MTLDDLIIKLQELKESGKYLNATNVTFKTRTGKIREINNVKSYCDRVLINYVITLES